MFRGFRGPLIYAEKHILLRNALMVILFALVCSAFWYSFEDTFKSIRNEKTYFDETKSTTKEEIEQFNVLSKCLLRTWNIQPLIHIRNGAVYIPSIKKNTLFIGVSSMPGQTVIVLPPLVRKMFSKKKIQDIEFDLDQCVQTKNSLPQCVLNTLDKIHVILGDPELDTYN